MTNIVSIKNIGLQNSFDLEVNHSDHQFYLSNNVLTSNSHSILYSITSYVTAYLKANFPIEFLLGNLMAELAAKTPNSKINVEKIKKELRQHRIKILPPDINDSDIHYKIVEANKLLTGLEGIKFVSEEAIQDIVIKRPFTSFADFMNRVDSSKVRANTIQALANSGCLDSLIKLEKGLNRKIIHQYCSDYRKKLQVWLKKHSLLKENFAYPYPNDSDWTSPEMYSLEHHYIGESFTCKPAKAYGDFFADGAVLFNQVKKAADKDKFKSLKGIVRDFFEFKVKKEDSKSFGKSMVKISLEDAVGDYITITVFPDRWEPIKDRMKQFNMELENGIAIHFSGSVNHYDNDVGIIVDQFYKAVPIPALPADLKHKKVSMRSTKKDVPVAEAIKQTKDDLFTELEDELFEDGTLQDIDVEYDSEN